MTAPRSQSCSVCGRHAARWRRGSGGRAIWYCEPHWPGRRARSRASVRHGGATAPPCKHCGQRPGKRARGLCWLCSQDGAIREQYPAAEHYYRQGESVLPPVLPEPECRQQPPPPPPPPAPLYGLLDADDVAVIERRGAGLVRAVSLYVEAMG